MSSATLDRSGLIEKAANLVQRGDLTGALRHYVRLFEESPSDWNVANALGDLYVRLGKTEDAVAHFISLAEQLAADGFTAKARALYRKILRIQPANAAALQRVEELDRHGQSASPFLQRVLETARAARETAPAEPPAVETPPPTSAAAPDPWNPYAPGPASAAAPPPPPLPEPPPPAPAASTPVEPQVIEAVPEGQPTDEFTNTETAADVALRRQDFAAAIAAIEQFLLTHPHHTGALEKLIEIAVDGSRTAELPWAQVRLAEACLEVGRYQQAQDVAIDLIFREPGSTRHQDLLERVTTTAREHRESLRRVPEFEAPCDPVTPAVEPAVPVAAPPAPPAIRLVEKRPAASPPPPPDADGDLPPDLREWSDPWQALEDIRTVLVEEAAAAAEERLAEAQRFIDAADVEHAARALEEAMCAPHLRALAGARLAALYRDVGAPVEALACLEWVAEMPPPNEDSGHELAYQLALTLEALGQQAQALGVYRELLAEVGPSYRDVASRTTRLSAA